MMEPYSTKKATFFQEKETSVGKTCMFILSFKKTYKKYQIKKIVISGGGYK